MTLTTRQANKPLIQTSLLFSELVKIVFQHITEGGRWLRFDVKPDNFTHLKKQRYISLGATQKSKRLLKGHLCE